MRKFVAMMLVNLAQNTLSTMLIQLRQGIQLNQLAQLLRNAGIIEARPGKHGGYRLAKDPADTNVLEIMEALDDDAKQSTRAKRDARKGGAMVQEIKQVYDLIEESMDAYLSSLTVQMLLDCARNGDNSRTFLAERLQEESRRLLDAVK